MFKGIGSAGEAGKPFGTGDLPNIERTLWSVLRLEGTLPAVVEGVGGGLRRKSVRMSVVGWGSDMFPKEEPERRFLRAFLLWRFMRQT